MSLTLKTLFLSLLFALHALCAPVAIKEQTNADAAAEETASIEQNISSVKSKIKSIEDGLSGSIWYKRYSDYLAAGVSKRAIFGELISVEEPKHAPKVESPFGIVGALSFIKESSAKKDIYETRLSELEKLTDSLKERVKLHKELVVLTDQRGGGSLEELEPLVELIKDENVALKYLLAEKVEFSKNVEKFKSKTNEENQRLQMDIKYQLTKLFNIALLIFAVIALSILAKIMIKKYSLSNHERAYLLSKTVNIITIVVIVLILLFSYINDVGYLVTILGFASAGIAIAMKDWFMSLLGWIAIVFGGSVKVGDRIKISSKEGVEVLGDVIDISLLTITMYEEVSLVSYRKNKRAGRIIFVPNNYIFTHIFLNYSHSGLTTVWDNVDITITFDSDMNEAIALAFEAATKHTKTFSRLTERSIRRMRTKYSIGDINTEPRVFTFIESNGVAVSVWYPTHSFSILKTKALVSREVLSAFMASPLVHIAFPTTSIVLQEGLQGGKNE